MGARQTTGGTSTARAHLSAPGEILDDANLPKLAKKAARHVHRPRGVDLVDAEQDAAVELLEYRRNGFDPEKCDHLSREAQERMLVRWTRLRLMSRYDSRIAAACITETHGSEDAFGPALDPYNGRDPFDLEPILARLPERERAVVDAIVVGGKQQREVAKLLGISATIVSRDFSAARQRIAAMLLGIE